MLQLVLVHNSTDRKRGRIAIYQKQVNISYVKQDNKKRGPKMSIKMLSYINHM